MIRYIQETILHIYDTDTNITITTNSSKETTTSPLLHDNIDLGYENIPSQAPVNSVTIPNHVTLTCGIIT